MPDREVLTDLPSRLATHYQNFTETEAEVNWNRPFR
jgi:hypothetical protein